MSTLNQTNLGNNLLNLQSYSKPDKHEHELHVGVSGFSDLGEPNTPFMRKVKTALVNSNENYIEDLNSAITDFEATGAQFTDIDQFKTDHSQYLEVYRRLSLLREYDKTSLQTILEEEFEIVPDANSTENKALRVRLWDNLIYHTHRPIHADFKLHMANVLRVFHLIGMVNTGEELTDLQIEQGYKSILKVDSGLLRIPFVLDLEDPETPEEEVDREQFITKLDTAEAFDKQLTELLNQRAYTNQEALSNFEMEFDAEGEVTNLEDMPTMVQTEKMDNDLFIALDANLQTFFTDELDFDIADEPLISQVETTLDDYQKTNTASLFDGLVGNKTMSVVWGNEVVLEGGGFSFGPVGPGNLGNPIGTGPVGTATLMPDPCKFDTFGVSDYRKVIQEWEEYKPAEIAHIENMMAGEKKERHTRHLRRKEETYTVETIREEETLRDTQTTERFALQTEVQKMIQRDLNTYLDANVSGSYGVANYAVQGGISFGSSLSESKSQSESYAKEVIDRATKRVMERFREERTIKVLEEFEDTNTHTIDNAVDISGTTAIGDNMVGVYRWINKIMNCKLVNYGRRLVLMFNVPEPAAFHLFAKSNMAEGVADSVEMPIDPANDGLTIGTSQIYLKRPEDLTKYNYGHWVGLYDAQVKQYPEPIVMNKSYKHTDDTSSSNYYAYNDNTSLMVPTDYYIDRVTWKGFHKNSSYMALTMNGYFVNFLGSSQSYFASNGVSHENLAISVLTKSNDWTLNVRANCKPTEESIAKWRLETFNAIMAAYNKKKQAAESTLAEMKNNQLFQLSGTNPASLRELESKELKKGCISIMNKYSTSLLTNYNSFFDHYNAMRYKNPPALSINSYPPNNYGYPEFIPCEAIIEGRSINFFENAFDWKIMNYKFNPYFWAQKKRWPFLYNIDHDDPLFANFLQAGSAMVLVPVKEGYENAVTNFIETGKMYENPAGVHSIEEAIDALIDVTLSPLADYNGDGIVDSSDVPPEWNTTVPTQLVMLQERSNGLTVNQPGTVAPTDLNQHGLPSNPDV